MPSEGDKNRQIEIETQNHIVIANDNVKTCVVVQPSRKANNKKPVTKDAMPMPVNISQVCGGNNIFVSLESMSVSTS
jgi:hypothetical protein